jgi:hypothetical protein
MDSKRNTLVGQERNAVALAWKMAAVAQLSKLEAVRIPTASQVEEIAYLRLELAQDSK